MPKLTLEQAVQMPQHYSRVVKTSPETTLDDAADIGPRSFSVELDDDSMSSRVPDDEHFRSGDLVVFDPDVHPFPGAFVCAHVEGEPKSIFRKYRPRGRASGESVYELAPLNPDYSTETVGPGHQQGRIIGVLIRHIRKFPRKNG